MLKNFAAKAVALGVLGLGVATLTPVPAHADDTFLVCPDGHSGIATGNTTCAFAQNVRTAYYNQTGPLVTAYSPVTGQTYTMQCQSGFTAHLNNGNSVNAIRCAGGNNAVVILF